MKRVMTHKQLKDTGWADFVRWAASKGLKPKDLLPYDIVSWQAHLCTLKLIGKVATDLYLKKLKRKVKIVGLSKQVR